MRLIKARRQRILCGQILRLAFGVTQRKRASAIRLLMMVFYNLDEKMDGDGLHQVGPTRPIDLHI